MKLILPCFEGLWHVYGCFLKWWYPQNTPKWSFLVGKPMVVGYHHFRKHPYRLYRHCILLGDMGDNGGLHISWARREVPSRKKQQQIEKTIIETQQKRRWKHCRDDSKHYTLNFTLRFPGITFWKELLLKGIRRIPNHWAPNHKLTISWAWRLLAHHHQSFIRWDSFGFWVGLVVHAPFNQHTRMHKFWTPNMFFDIWPPPKKKSTWIWVRYSNDFVCLEMFFTKACEFVGCFPWTLNTHVLQMMIGTGTVSWITRPGPRTMRTDGANMLSFCSCNTLIGLSIPLGSVYLLTYFIFDRKINLI